MATNSRPGLHGFPNAFVIVDDRQLRERKAAGNRIAVCLLVQLIAFEEESARFNTIVGITSTSGNATPLEVLPFSLKNWPLRAPGQEQEDRLVQDKELR